MKYYLLVQYTNAGEILKRVDEIELFKILDKYKEDLENYKGALGKNKEPDKIVVYNIGGCLLDWS